MINLIKLLAVTAILFLIFIIATDLSAATSETANIELTTSPIYSGSAVINPDTNYSPVSGDKIVDQGALGQYTPNNYLQFDAFDFHGNYQGNYAQELTPIPDPTDTVSLPSNFPVLGNVFTLEVQVYSAAHDILGHRTIIGNDANPSGREKDRPPTITFNKVNGVNQIRYGFGVGPDQKGKRRIIESVVTDNQWYHIAFTFDGTTTKLYVDGIEVDSSDFASGLTPHPVPISIIGRKFLGKIDEVRIWNIARTQGDIQSTLSTTLLGNEPGLVAYYPMNVNQDWELIDQGPNNYNAAITNVEILQRYSSTNCPNPNGTFACPYLTINGALDNSQGGDTIFIKNGRYSEVLFKELLNQSYETEGPKLTLKGESQNVILDGTVPLTTTWQLVDGKYESSVDMNQLSNAAGAKVEDIYGLWIDDRYMIPAMPVNFTNPTDITTGTQNNPEIGTVFDKNITAPYEYAGMVQDTYIVGDINNLDAAEEWSFDKVNNKLYLIPGQKIPNTTNVRVRVRTQLLSFQFSDNLEFKNLHFFAGSFSFHKGSFILLEDSKFSHSWEVGMNYLKPGYFDFGVGRTNLIKGGTNNTVRNSIFQYINDAFALKFANSMYPLAENVLFQYNDWFKNTVWAPGATQNFKGGNKWHDDTSVVGGSTFRYITMDQNHTGGLQPGLNSLVEYARIQNQYINIDGSGIQRTRGNATNSTTRYSWLLDTNRNGMRLDSSCGGTDAVIHNVVSAGNKRGFRLKGDRHRAFHLLGYDTNQNDISMPRNKYCGDDPVNDNSETMAGNLNSRLLNSVAEKNLSAHMPDAGDPNITLGNTELIAENTSNEFLLNQSGIWYGRALDEDKIAPFTYPHFELQDPWVENRERSDTSLQSQFGLNPFINGVQGFDFRPRKGSPLLDGGVVIPGINDGQDIDPSQAPNHPPSYIGQHRAFVGDAPDIGAYEYGDSVYWIPGFRYYYPTVPIPSDGAVDVPMEYGLAFNYPWKTDYSNITAQVTINGPGVNKTVSLNYPNNVVFETFLPGQTYTWSVKVGDVSSQIWSFTVANKIHPLNDRSVNINVDDEKLIPNHNKSLNLSDGVLSFMRFDIPSSINSDYQVFLNLTPETVTSLNGQIMLYKYNYQGWGENLDTNNIGLLDHSLLTLLKTISTIDLSSSLSVEITDYIDATGEISFALGVSDPDDQLSFYSKEKMVTDGVDLYVEPG
ncbi:MAG: LamG domain-containing protein, partial [SAR202 cluster bacterium]|nr:LamG domain-containing protein [SAR202 cluster bacterium]